MRIARVLAAGARLQALQLSADRLMLFSILVQPFFVAVTAMFILRHRSDFDPMYVVLGAGLSGLWTVALFDGAQMIQSERWSGTLELVVATPTSMSVIMGGRLLGSMVFAIASMIVAYAVGALLFGYALVVHEPASFAVSLVLSLVALWSMALVLSPAAILWRTAARLLGILEYPVYGLSGFLFPIAILPPWSAALSHALPTYWASEALHGTASGSIGFDTLAIALLMLFAATVIDVAVARVLLARVLEHARGDASLALA